MPYLIQCSNPACSNRFTLDESHDAPDFAGLVCETCYEEYFLKKLDDMYEGPDDRCWRESEQWGREDDPPMTPARY